MNRHSGKALSGEDHIAQSIGDILTTPIGSRVMRRDYGSRLFELVDTPLNSRTSLLWTAATAAALDKWEPRLRVTRVKLTGFDGSGTPQLTITGERTDIPRSPELTLSIPV
ncbi:GPW/gp25 family protein [Altericroceibacterium endophyticum]